MLDLAEDMADHTTSVKAENTFCGMKKSLLNCIDFDKAYGEFKVAIESFILTDMNSNESGRSQLIEDLAALMTVVKRQWKSLR